MAEVQALGKYEIRGTLGRGAMGVVYDGWDPLIARRVAIKAVRLPEHPESETEEEIARFRREAQAAGRLTHPNIVAVYDYGETSELAYIVMEYVDGTTLKQLLDRQERFAVADAARIMQDVLTGLQYSHERGVVHRDIKPANIMLTSAGQAKIADFGIARIESSSMTQVGTVLGTPAYMSPEQFRGEVVTERTDIYSSGVLLYQLLTGERPFEGSPTGIMHKVLSTEPPPPSELAGSCPVALDAVVRQAMSKRPEDRYSSAGAFAAAITAGLAARPMPGRAEPETEATMVVLAARPTPPPTPPAAVAPARSAPERPRRAWLIAASVAGIVVLGAGGGWFALRPGGTASSPSPGAETVPSAAERPPADRTAGTTGAATPNANVAARAPTTRPPAASPTVAPPSPAGAVPPAEPATATAGTAAAAPPATPPVASPMPSAQPAAPPAPVTPPPIAPPPAETASSAPASPPAGGAATAPPPAPATPANPPSSAAPAPAPEQVAAIGLGSLRRQIEQALAATSCALVDGAVQDSGTVTINGIAGGPADDALRRAVAGVAGSHALDWRVRQIDPVFCAALAAIRPVAALAGAPDAGLRLALADGRTALHEGEFIRPRVSMADFPGRLRVDYFAHDGSLAHLYPTVADASQHLVAVPARTLRAGELLRIGDPGGGHPQWDVGPPYGTDMIIAVASSVPLLDPPPPSNFEADGTDYLRRLGRAIEGARDHGASVAGTILLVDTLAKSP